jgi:hypothetical protein
LVSSLNSSFRLSRLSQKKLSQYRDTRTDSPKETKAFPKRQVHTKGYKLLQLLYIYIYISMNLLVFCWFEVVAKLSQSCRACRKLLLILSCFPFVFLTFQNRYLFCDNFIGLVSPPGFALCRFSRMAFALV